MSGPVCEQACVQASLCACMLAYMVVREVAGRDSPCVCTSVLAVWHAGGHVCASGMVRG